MPRSLHLPRLFVVVGASVLAALLALSPFAPASVLPQRALPADVPESAEQEPMGKAIQADKQQASEQLQDAVQLDPDKLAKDVELVQHVQALLTTGTPTLTVIRAALGGKIQELGFGVRRVMMAAPGGYTYVFVRAVALAERLACFELTVTSDDDWALVASHLRPLLDNDAEPFDKGLRWGWQDEQVQRELRAHVAERLFGESAPRLDEELAGTVAELTDPMREDLLDMGTTAGPSPTRVIVNRWVADRRVDGLRALLRGPHEVMRVYGVEGLLRMEKAGVPLADRDRAAIDQVLDLDIGITAAMGCVVLSDTAPSLLKVLPR